MITTLANDRSLPYRHLADLTDGRALFEHARHADPRVDHGYCLDDVARALVVVVREPRRTPMLEQLTETYLRFVEQAFAADGRAHNRMDVTGTWADDLAVSDWWGRGVAALGFTVANASQRPALVRAMRAFLRAARQRPTDVRAAAFAALGAADVLTARPSSRAARRLLLDVLPLLPVAPVAEWAWIEPRLRYANATLAEALLAIGTALDEPGLVARGLAALDALVAIETRNGHLSVTGHSGRGPEDHGPLFDQQPIEVAAIADAAARAYALTGDKRWKRLVRVAWNWFEGDNDGGMPMIDPSSGAGYDGLELDGRNNNRGAESTLAALGTFQQMQAVDAASERAIGIRR
ncbi:MAG: glycosyltransferase [Pseudolysinimonas sp.]